jgi:hypothetical protein
MTDEVRKLLGGYATGTLTDGERDLLFSAALQDQELFDALADEEALRDLLAGPAARQTLLEQLQRQPVLDAALLRDRQAPLEIAARAAAPPPRPVFAEPPRGWYRFTPSRLAVVAAFAMLLLIAGGIQYKRLHAPEPTRVASVKLAMDRTAALSVQSQAPAPRAVPRSATPARVAVPKEAAPQAADARVANAVELDRATQTKDETPLAAPPAIAPTDSEKKGAEKETTGTVPAREQLNQAVRDRVARQQAAQGASAAAASSGKASERRLAPISPSQIVTGGLRPAAAPPPPPAAKVAAFAGQSREIDAKVTDINGTIVSINAGSNAGLRAGDVIEIVRENRVIATSKLSQVGATFAVGPLQRTEGSADTPQAGDTVRRAR